MKKLSLLLVFISFLSCEKNQLPTCEIIRPDNGDEMVKGETLIISVNANDTDGKITEVRFYLDGSLVGSSSGSGYPYHYEWNTASEETGSYTIKATAQDNGGSSTSDEIAVFLIASGWETGTVTDYDGNTYKTIKIGNQWWMAENLKTTYFDNGTEIPLVESISGWKALGKTDKAYCWYDYTLSNGDIYGALYTWAAATNGSRSYANPSGIQGVCPSGWHLPSYFEWTELTDYLGGAGIAGGKLKKTGLVHWNWPNTGATNESGFTALPGGCCGISGYFFHVREGGFWWSTREETSYAAWYRYLNCRNSSFLHGEDAKAQGLSVRCIKD